MSILTAFLLPAITFGFAAGAQPGPLTIYLISKTLQNGLRKTFPAIFVPVITDGPVAVICLLILTSLPSMALNILQIAGGIFLTYLAINAFRTWKRREGIEIAETSSQKTLRDAIVINLLNPNAYLGWSLVMGPMLIKGWKESPATGIALLGCFYLTMFIVSAIVLLIFDQARERAPKVQHLFMGLAAICLAFFGIYQFYSGIVGIMGH